MRASARKLEACFFAYRREVGGVCGCMAGAWRIARWSVCVPTVRGGCAEGDEREVLGVVREGAPASEPARCTARGRAVGRSFACEAEKEYS